VKESSPNPRLPYDGLTLGTLIRITELCRRVRGSIFWQSKFRGLCRKGGEIRSGSSPNSRLPYVRCDMNVRPCAQDGESLESWQNIVQGLSQLCLGLAYAGREGAWEGELPIFLEPDLCGLHDMAGLPAGRAAVLRIAAAMPDCDAAATLRQR
jgi:hypothetical protein